MQCSYSLSYILFLGNPFPDKFHLLVLRYFSFLPTPLNLWPPSLSLTPFWFHFHPHSKVTLLPFRNPRSFHAHFVLPLPVVLHPQHKLVSCFFFTLFPTVSPYWMTPHFFWGYSCYVALGDIMWNSRLSAKNSFSSSRWDTSGWVLLKAMGHRFPAPKQFRCIPEQTAIQKGHGAFTVLESHNYCTHLWASHTAAFLKFPYYHVATKKTSCFPILVLSAYGQAIASFKSVYKGLSQQVLWVQGHWGDLHSCFSLDAARA